MKKTITVAALTCISMSALAAGPVSLTQGGANQQVTSTQCSYLPDSGHTATISLSQGVYGAYDCNTISAGVATSHGAGKKKVYKGTTAGGQIDEGQASSLINSSDSLQTYATQGLSS